MSRIKQVFTSRFPNGRLIEADFGQLEIVALSFLSGDVNLQQDLKDGIDLHCMSAALMEGTTYKYFKDAYDAGNKTAIAKRKLAKALSFQLQYGAGPKKMAEETGCSEEEARNFIMNYYIRYSGVKRYHKRLLHAISMARVPSTKHTTSGLPAGISKFKSITGRIYTFYEEDDFKGTPSFKPTKIKNYPVQGFATADIVPMVLGEIHKDIYRKELQDDVLLINTIHDSILLDVKETFVCTGLEILYNNMRNVPQLLLDRFGITFPLEIKVDIKAGRNWANMKEVL